MTVLCGSRKEVGIDVFQAHLEFQVVANHDQAEDEGMQELGLQSGPTDAMPFILLSFDSQDICNKILPKSL